MVKQLMTVDEIKKLLSQTLVGRLGTSKNDEPYVVPICFIHHKGKIYFHCASEGKKLDNIKANPSVCFQVDEYQLVPSSTPCKFTMHYRSVLVFGRTRFLTNQKEKLKILKLLINKYDGTKLTKPLDETMTHRVEVGEITIEKSTGKKN